MGSLQFQIFKGTNELNLSHISCLEPTNRAKLHQKYVRVFPIPKSLLNTAGLNKTEGFFDVEIAAKRAATLYTWYSFSAICRNASLRSTLGRLHWLVQGNFAEKPDYRLMPDPGWPCDPNRHLRNWSNGILAEQFCSAIPCIQTNWRQSRREIRIQLIL